ncbi:hypothetical protein GOODEAATRI_007565 [Goodea atripinnis]|uniref:Uncharacterized protein n=1 Tax=Goodea atripinnis TaxID=208336 RepID=A0ABV0PW42_9TELE
MMENYSLRTILQQFHKVQPHRQRSGSLVYRTKHEEEAIPAISLPHQNFIQPLVQNQLYCQVFAHKPGIDSGTLPATSLSGKVFTPSQFNVSNRNYYERQPEKALSKR